MKHSMQRLSELAFQNGPLCVGLDTDPSYLPPNLIGDNPAQSVLDFNKCLIEGIARDKSASCFKVQAAYYEAMGIMGMKAFSETLRAARKSGLVAISDVKRGDIAATADAYARAHFTGEFEADIITVNPYMGFDTLSPFVSFCADRGKGIFVLLRTSNPGAADIEQKKLESGGRVLDAVGGALEQLAEESRAAFPDQICPPVGAVVGCTDEADARALREEHSALFFLIPGYGAQGGRAAVCAALLGGAGGVVNSSRGILLAWKRDAECRAVLDAGKTLTLEDITKASRREALRAKSELLSFTSKRKTPERET